MLQNWTLSHLTHVQLFGLSLSFLIRIILSFFILLTGYFALRSDYNHLLITSFNDGIFTVLAITELVLSCLFYILTIFICYKSFSNGGIWIMALLVILGFLGFDYLITFVERSRIVSNKGFFQISMLILSVLCLIICVLIIKINSKRNELAIFYVISWCVFVVILYAIALFYHLIVDSAYLRLIDSTALVVLSSPLI